MFTSIWMFILKLLLFVISEVEVVPLFLPEWRWKTLKLLHLSLSMYPTGRHNTNELKCLNITNTCIGIDSFWLIPISEICSWTILGCWIPCLRVYPPSKVSFFYSQTKANDVRSMSKASTFPNCLILWSSGNFFFCLHIFALYAGFFIHLCHFVCSGHYGDKSTRGKQKVWTIYTDYFLFRDEAGLLNLTAAEDGPIAFYICLISSSVRLLLLFLLFTPSEA